MKIKELRKKNHLTQQQLADKLHVARMTVITWEQDKFVPDTPNQIALSRAFQQRDSYFTDLLYLDSPKETKDRADTAEITAVMLAAEDSEKQAEIVHGIIMVLYDASKKIEKSMSEIDGLGKITEVDQDLIDHQLAYLERQIGIAREYLAASAYVKEQKSLGEDS